MGSTSNLEFPSNSGTAVGSSLAPTLDPTDHVQTHIARELHDQVAQPLIGLILEIQELRAGGVEGETLGRALDRMQDMVRHVLRQTREMLVDLRGQGDLRLDFVEVLRHELQVAPDTSPRTGIRLHASSRWPRPINGWAAFNLMRIVHEAVINARRHAEAHTIDIFLDTNDEGEAVVVVVDDGLGIRDAPAGFGMVGMAERALILGGTFNVKAREVGGTRVEVRVPSHRLE